MSFSGWTSVVNDKPPHCTAFGATSQDSTPSFFTAVQPQQKQVLFLPQECVMAGYNESGHHVDRQPASNLFPPDSFIQNSFLQNSFLQRSPVVHAVREHINGVARTESPDVTNKIHLVLEQLAYSIQLNPDRTELIFAAVYDDDKKEEVVTLEFIKTHIKDIMKLIDKNGVYGFWSATLNNGRVTVYPKNSLNVF